VGVERQAALERQAAMVEELRKAELVRDRLESLEQLVRSYPEGHDTRVLSRTSAWTGRSERWRRTPGPFGTLLSTLVVPEKQLGFRDPGFYADGWAGVSGWVLVKPWGVVPLRVPTRAVLRVAM
jgi:hypothetical protein